MMRCMVWLWSNLSGNYLLLGGSGDEEPSYSADGTGQWSGYSSDTRGSYLVVVDPAGNTLYQNYFGTPDGVDLL